MNTIGMNVIMFLVPLSQKYIYGYLNNTYIILHSRIQELISSEAGPCDIVYSRLSEEIGQTASCSVVVCVDFPSLGNKKCRSRPTQGL